MAWTRTWYVPSCVKAWSTFAPVRDVPSPKSHVYSRIGSVSLDWCAPKLSVSPALPVDGTVATKAGGTTETSERVSLSTRTECGGSVTPTVALTDCAGACGVNTSVNV